MATLYLSPLSQTLKGSIQNPFCPYSQSHGTVVLQVLKAGFMYAHYYYSVTTSYYQVGTKKLAFIRY